MATMVLSIVPAAPSPEATQEIVNLVNAAYRGETAAQGWASEAHVLLGQRLDRDMLHEMLSGTHQALLVLRDREGGPILGCVHVGATADPMIWHLSMLTVDPARQADGLGRLLLSHAEEYLRAQRARRVSITVIWLRDTLLAWYERRGFRPTGRTEPFPYGKRTVWCTHPRRPLLSGTGEGAELGEVAGARTRSYILRRLSKPQHRECVSCRS